MTEQISERRGPGRPSLKDAVPAPSLAPNSPLPANPDQHGKPQAARFVRKPFGQHKLKLDRPKREGFERRWFNDTPGRILRAQEAGWEIVLKPSGEPEKEVVGVAETGGPLLAVLMEVPKEWFDEDIAAQQKAIDEMEQAYKRGTDNHGQPDRDGRYIPQRGISIRTV